MRATLKTYRQSPRKVRLVADTIRGKRVSEALTVLSFLEKRAAAPIRKLLESAVANARQNFGADPDGLAVREITVNKGAVLKRSMPRARGRATPIRKRTSHISITLGE
ncbi:MAG: 50S ribosomal protein L22 [bacterium]|nr:50S ribosomal protein L22 [bacterium]MDZ4284607.1 50S ribosomal protein L22 [Patescibacteria group bacterium]